ncbi:RING-H2 finger protein ATL54-like [Phragmites australis]|uniref:RING-H2 finger protein ATL54-like n=1 Tax=Phragmites australis TaxID=29695 RepID=UPI002D7901B2|nr:RING-H2 finger protein ATL54-like [Phragmites australis]
MMPRRRQIEHLDHEDCGSPEHWCSPPPAPVLAPPSPYAPPPSSPASHGRSTFVTALIIAGSALAFLVVCLSIFLVAHRRGQRRRRRRRRRDALLEATLAPAAPAAFPDGGLGPEEEVVHHAWNIRTVGLDEAAIESIALTPYRAGTAGVLGASDCTVCLGEFRDGELLRLLPKCAHAFHVPCIDTWLRAHVNCPLCRAHVLDPAAAAEQLDSPPGADSNTEQAVSGIRTTEPEQLDQQANEQRELRVQIERRDQPSSSPERLHQDPGPRGRNFRRVASMDSPSPISSAEEAPEEEQAGSEKKQGTGGAVYCELSTGSGHLKNHRGMKRSLSVGNRWALLSRHCRRSSSLLPL